MNQLFVQLVLSTTNCGTIPDTEERKFERTSERTPQGIEESLLWKLVHYWKSYHHLRGNGKKHVA